MEEKEVRRRTHSADYVVNNITKTMRPRRVAAQAARARPWQEALHVAMDAATRRDEARGRPQAAEQSKGAEPSAEAGAYVQA